ncbi:MAG: hypothetical protein RLZZ254_762 [Actinomycetota bacterium]
MPQAWRVVRHNTVEGVAILSQMQGFIAGGMWVVYGIAGAEPVISLGNGVVTVGIGVVLVQMVRLNVLTKTQLIGILLGIYSFAIVLQVFSLNALGAIAGVIGSSGIIPQVWKAARQSHLKGVSASGNALLALTTVSWGVYSIFIDDPLLAASNFVIVLPASFIAFRAVQSHRKYGSEVASLV